VLPPGLQYVPGTVQVLTAAGSGTPPFTLVDDFEGSLPTEAVTGGVSDGDDVIVTFPGLTTVAADNDTNNNAIVLRLQATVLDVSSNVGVPPQTVLVNQATIAAEGTAPFPSNQTANPVVEPRLAIVKTASPTQAEQGDPITLTIAVTNTGTSTSFEVVVEDVLPPEYDATTVVQVATPADFVFNQVGSVITYQGGDIAAGETVTFVITANLVDDLPVGDQVTNTATASEASTLPGAVPGERTEPAVDDTATVNLVDADLVITKSDNDLTVLPGDTQVYDLVITNVGGATATNVTVTDTLPPSAAFVAVGGVDCTLAEQDGQNITIDIAVDIPPNGSVTCTLTLTIDNPLPAGVTTFTNVADVHYDGDEDDPSPNNNHAEDTDTKDPAATPDLQVVKDDGQTVVAPGQALTYDVVVTNVGTVGATNVLVTDTIPADTTFVACRTDPDVGCSFNPITRMASALFPGVAGGGAEVSMEVEVLVDNPLPAGVDDILNTVTVVDDGSNGPDPTPENNTDTDTDTVDAAPDMAIVKTAGADLVVPGQTYGYTLRVTNIGDQEATGVVVTDTVPQGLTVDCASVTQPVTVCDAATGALQWGPGVPLPDPFPRATIVTLSYEVTVDNPAEAGTTTFPNTARVADDGANGVDPTPANNQSSAETSLDPAQTFPDLSVVKDDGLTTVTPGQAVTYSVVVTNGGNIGATNVVVTDTLPPDTTFASCTTVPAVPCTESGGVVTATFPVLAGGGAQVTLEIAMTVDTPQPAGVETLTNTVTVEDDGTNGPDPTPEDNTDDDTDELEAAPDLSVTKDDGLLVVEPGEQTTYTIIATNVGNQDATNVVVTDNLPQATSFVSCTTTPPVTCAETAPGSGVVTATFSQFPVGATFQLSLTVQVADPLPAGVLALFNRVTVTDDRANGPDPTPENNSDFDIDVVRAAPDLVVTKDDGLDVVAPGDVVTYTITVTNVGNQGAADVVVTDVLPPQLIFVSCDPACDSTALPTVTWNLGELPGLGSGANSVTLELTVTVVDPMPVGVEEIAKPVEAEPGGLLPCPGALCPDPTPDNNRDIDIDGVDAAPDMVIVKEPSVGQVDGGGAVTYTLTVTNAGNQDATGVTVTDSVPPGMTIDCASAAPVATVCDPATGALEWGPPWSPSGSADPWPAGESAAFTYRVTVADPVPSGVKSFLNTATVADDGENGDDPTPENNTDTADVVVKTTVTIDKQGPQEAETGELVTYTMVVTNAGHSEATGVVVTDPVPAGLVWVSASGTGWTCSGTATVTCSLAGPLPAGGQSTLQLTFRVTAADGATIVNVAEVTDDDCNCDSDDATTRIDDPAGLSATGFYFAGLVPLALSLIVVGTGLALVARRRRLRPT
jgi:uncharacterized repeat protein (TIGR01451 family)